MLRFFFLGFALFSYLFSWYSLYTLYIFLKRVPFGNFEVSFVQTSIVTNIMLLVIFLSGHSFFAQQNVKKIWRQIGVPFLERSIYSLISSWTLLVNPLTKYLKFVALFTIFSSYW